jgi:uncharacterized protein YjbI with pentapeptide repeats
VAFACALGFALVAVPQAAAKVYWTNNTTNTIGAANLAGTDVNQSLIVAGGGPYGLAVRDSVLYWSNNSSIGRADIFGPMFSQNFITATNPRGVAIDGNYVYWATDTAGVDTIARANLDGTGTNQNFITGVDDPEGVAVDGGHIYWANSGLARIGRANLDGTSKNQNFITTGGGPFGVAVDGGHIYWANLFNDTIARANLDGTNVNQSFITGASSPRGVAVDGQHVYWGNTGPNTIGRANLDGSGVNQSLIATAPRARSRHPPRRSPSPRASRPASNAGSTRSRLPPVARRRPTAAWPTARMSYRCALATRPATSTPPRPPARSSSTHPSSTHPIRPSRN